MYCLVVVGPTCHVFSVNDMGVGRSAAEVLRLVQAFTFHDQHGEVCPASWRPGQDSIKPDVEAAKEFFSKTVDDDVLEYLDAGFKKLQASDSKSKLKKFLTKDVFQALRTKKTPTFGSSLKDVVQSGMENLDSGIGLYAPDAEAYSVFAPLFDPVIGKLIGHQILSNFALLLQRSTMEASRALTSILLVISATPLSLMTWTPRSAVPRSPAPASPLTV